MARSTFYHQLKRPARAGADALRDAVARVHAQHRGRYGYRRITAQLQAEGLAVNAKAVRARMRALGLAGHCPPRKRRRPAGEASGIAPNVLARDFAAAAPGRKWATDVTQYTIRGETGYFSPMIDLFNGEIVAYSLARRPGLELVLTMARRAFRAARPPAGVIVHSDQGCLYQHRDYRDLLKRHGAVQSMSRRGNCWDNACAESLFARMKIELLRAQEWASLAAFERALARYVEYYNRARRRLGGESPARRRAQYELKNSVKQS